MSESKGKSELDHAIDEARACIDAGQREGFSPTDAHIVNQMIREIRALRWYVRAYTDMSDETQKLRALLGGGDPILAVEDIRRENARLKDDLNTIGLVMIREKIEAGKRK